MKKLAFAITITLAIAFMQSQAQAQCGWGGHRVYHSYAAAPVVVAAPVYTVGYRGYGYGVPAQYYGYSPFYSRRYVGYRPYYGGFGYGRYYGRSGVSIRVGF